MIKKFLAFLLLVTFSFSFTDGIFANNNQNNSEIIFTSENQKVIIYENGVEIKGKYYTKEEFEELLKTAKKLNIQPRMAFLIPAGSYVIPGIGAVLVEGGKIFIAGTLIAAGSWLESKILEYFSSTKSVEEEYNDAKRECRPNKNNNQDSDTDRGWFGEPTGKKAFSTITFFKEGRLAKIRFFDKNGNAELDIHFEHGGKETHVFPHCHKWIKNSKGSMSPLKWYKCCQ